ncbi:kinesin-related protein 4-like isoform X3 [Bradysia coprophila]|uniref:kinesin-related protein 4-like isoform X3 n=1 Tax=Bradysia coprophila TaxID=38358 RepID=UPI00187DA565|nr:kinesin-related protein 4-like isoform X3 [Bradysia coprophila]
MSNIKVCVKIRPLSERDVKLKKEEQWKVADNKSLQCVNVLHPCEFTFDHIFGTKSLNYEVYLLIVRPVVESCLMGFNGTIITYGQASAGKNYTMLGTDMDPGIVLITIERLFKTGGFFRRTIRFGYVEIYKEKIYDLLNDRKPAWIDKHNFDFMLSNDEIVVENFEKAVEMLRNVRKLSSTSHSILRITIESEDKTKGKMLISHLIFVHVAGCDPMTEVPLSDSLDDESTKSLYWFNVVVNGLHKGEKNINFNNSVLTTLLRESLTGTSNTAIICNIRPDVVEETISTLKFVSRAKNVRTLPICNEMSNVPARCSTPVSTNLTHVEHQLIEIANTKIENLLLRKELEDVKAAFAAKTTWFEEQMKGAELSRQKLELAQIEEKKSLERIQNRLNTKIKMLTDSNEYLTGKLEGLQQDSSAHSFRNASESLTPSQNENSTLTRSCAENLEKHEKHQLDTVAKACPKRQIDDLASEWTNNGRARKYEGPYRKADVKPNTELIRPLMSDETETRTVAVPNYRIGCVIGVGGVKMKSLIRATGARISVSRYSRDSARMVTINGNTRSVCMAVDMIQQMLKYDD